MQAHAQRLNPLVFRIRQIVLRVLITGITAHLGSVFGRHLFFWAFNSVDSVWNSYSSEWTKWIMQCINPRAAELALESALMAYNNLWMQLVVASSLLCWCFCLAKHKWKLFYFSVFISFASLVFVAGLAWKV